MSYPMTVYARPHGHKTESIINHITLDDENWYRENNITVGMEDIGSSIVIYAKYGAEDEDEITYIVPTNETCEVSMANIRKRIMEIRS